MSTTCVSGYWNIKNKHGDKFESWFQNTLRVNCPYVFFCDSDTKEKIEKFRVGLPTYFVLYNIEDFVTYKYKDRMKTHKRHCPSVELNLIWNEKIFMLKKAADLNPYSSDFFCWIDAGICSYRKKPPPITAFPNPDKLSKLPTDKLIFSSFEKYQEHLVTRSSYYYYITGTYLIHSGVIDEFASIYEEYLDKLVDKGNIWTDQLILTHIFKDRPSLFHKIGEGWGEVIKFLME